MARAAARRRARPAPPPEPVPNRRPSQRQLVAAAALVLGLMLLGMVGPALLLLAAALVAGYGLTFLSGLELSVEERLAYGSVIGAMAVCLAGFGVATSLGVGVPGVTVAMALALVASAAGWQRGAPRIGVELSDFKRRWTQRWGAADHPWPLWVVLSVCWAYSIHLFGQSYRFTEKGLIAGNPGAYADWAAHLTYAGSFAYGHNFPPQFPVDPGHAFAYPFMVDFFAAQLVPLGTNLTSALVLTSGFLALAFPAVMYLAAARLLGSRAAAALAVMVFLLGGGIGFVNLAGDLDRQGLTALAHLPRLYTQDVDHNYQLLNPVLAYMVPQRSTLFGFSVALIVTALLWAARRQEGAAPYAFAGVLVGVSPIFHVYGFGTALVLCVFWALIERRRQWLIFFVPALALGVPVALWMLQTGGASAIRWLPGWYTNPKFHSHDTFVWFWFKNTGLFIPLLLVAQLWRRLLPPGLSLRLAPIWLWFVVPNLVQLQPWEWDNTKYFAFWALFGSLLVGALLARLARAGVEGLALVAVLFSLLGLAGGLDLARTSDYSVSASVFTDRGGIALADWVRENTPSQAVFAVGPGHNEPVPTLAGRRVMAGYGGWLWTYGLKDWYSKTTDEELILKGDPAAESLARQYRVTYVVIGPQEIAAGANRAYWDQSADRVYSRDGYTVYRVR